VKNDKKGSQTKVQEQFEKNTLLDHKITTLKQEREIEKEECFRNKKLVYILDPRIDITLQRCWIRRCRSW
jgi:hypothetical protein